MSTHSSLLFWSDIVSQGLSLEETMTCAEPASLSVYILSSLSYMYLFSLLFLAFFFNLSTMHSIQIPITIFLLRSWKSCFPAVKNLLWPHVSLSTCIFGKCQHWSITQNPGNYRLCQLSSGHLLNLDAEQVSKRNSMLLAWIFWRELTFIS